MGTARQRNRLTVRCWLWLVVGWLSVTPSASHGALCAYATLYDADQIAVIDVEANAVTGYVPAMNPAAVTVSPDGRRAFVAAGAERLIILDTSTHTRIGTVTGLIGRIVDMAANADGRSLLVQTEQALQVIDLADGAVRARERLEPPMNPVPYFAGLGCGLLRLSGDQHTALVVECSGRARVYSLLDWFAPILIAETNMGQVVVGAALAADGQTMFLAGADASVHAFDALTSALMWSTSIVGWIDDLVLSPDHTQLLVLEGGWAELHALDVASGNELSRAALPTYGKLSVTPDGRRAYLNETSGPLTLVDLETRETEAQLRLSEGPVAVASGNMPSCGPPVPQAAECDSSAVCLRASSPSGYPGETLTIDVSLHSPLVDIAGVQSILKFAPAAAVQVCRSNHDIQKPSMFAFRPQGCTRGVDCTSVMSLTISLEDVDPIPDSAVLFRCEVRIADDAPAGSLSFRITEIHASTPSADSFVGQNIDGIIRVLPIEGTRSLPEGASGAHSGCAIGGPMDSQPCAATLLLALLGFGLRYAKPSARPRTDL